MIDAQKIQRFSFLISKWMRHFFNYPDYQKRLERRLFQEKYQEDHIRKYESVIDFKNKNILDVGCGMGGLLTAMLLRGYNVSGLDFNPDYCEITKLRAAKYGFSPLVLEGVLEQLPFAGSSFDVVICSDVLEHVQNPIKSLEEINRVLKPGGKLLLTITNRFSLRDPHYHTLFVNWLPRVLADWIIEILDKKDISMFKDCQKLSQMHYYTQKEAGDLFIMTGFKQSNNLTRGELLSVCQTRLNKFVFFLFWHLGFGRCYLFFYYPAWTFLLSK